MSELRNLTYELLDIGNDVLADISYLNYEAEILSEDQIRRFKDELWELKQSLRSLERMSTMSDGDYKEMMAAIADVILYYLTVFRSDYTQAYLTKPPRLDKYEEKIYSILDRAGVNIGSF